MTTPQSLVVARLCRSGAKARRHVARPWRNLASGILPELARPRLFVFAEAHGSIGEVNVRTAQIAYSLITLFSIYCVVRGVARFQSVEAAMHEQTIPWIIPYLSIPVARKLLPSTVQARVASLPV